MSNSGPHAQAKEKILADIKAVAAGKYNCDDQASSLLAILGVGLMEQMANDMYQELEDQEDSEKNGASSVHLFKAVDSHNLYFFSVELKNAFAQYSHHLKKRSVQNMRNGGFGNTHDHIQFIRNVFANEHKTIESDFIAAVDADESESD